MMAYFSCHLCVSQRIETMEETEESFRPVALKKQY